MKEMVSTYFPKVLRVEEEAMGGSSLELTRNFLIATIIKQWNGLLPNVLCSLSLDVFKKGFVWYDIRCPAMGRALD